MNWSGILFYSMLTILVLPSLTYSLVGAVTLPAAIGLTLFNFIREGRKRLRERGKRARDIDVVECPFCGHSVSRHAFICSKCHRDLRINCPECGAVVNLGYGELNEGTGELEVSCEVCGEEITVELDRPS